MYIFFKQATSLLGSDKSSFSSFIDYAMRGVNELGPVAKRLCWPVWQKTLVFFANLNSSLNSLPWRTKRKPVFSFQNFSEHPVLGSEGTIHTEPLLSFLPALSVCWPHKVCGGGKQITKKPLKENKKRKSGVFLIHNYWQSCSYRWKLLWIGSYWCRQL